MCTIILYVPRILLTTVINRAIESYECVKTGLKGHETCTGVPIGGFNAPAHFYPDPLLLVDNCWVL